MNSFKNQIVWIIGASSGIGRALALELAARGAIIALSARRTEELEDIQTQIGLQHKIFPLDVTDTDNSVHTLRGIVDEYGRIDRIIFLAGNYAPMKIDALDMDKVKQIVNVNLIGAFNIVHASIPLLKDQKIPSQIALCGSVAGFVGLPNGQPYSATKAAIINLAETISAECDRKIDVRLINPGFVRTPLTDKNKFKMPALIEPEEAAREIADGLADAGFEIHFPKRFTFFVKFLRALPYFLSLRINKKFAN